MRVFLRQLGPGLLWAATAIGVSHLVQSTRAGAYAGFGLAGVIALALVLKYPFFEYGPRHAAATGESLVEGYHRVGRWALWLYVGITLSTALIIQVAVVLFTTFVVGRALGVAWPPPVTAALLVGFCAVLLRVGRYRGLDIAIKVVLVLLALSSLVAAGIALPRVDPSTLALWPPATAAVPFAFILALVGWMPSGVDVSVWSSLWTLARGRVVGERASVPHALLDFRIGYLGTTVMAFAFLSLGAGVMFRSGESFSAQGAVFSLQLVDLYAQTLGAWTRPLVVVAVVTTMFSTALTVVDGFPRAIERALRVLAARGPTPGQGDEGPIYWWSIVVLGVLTVLVLALFLGSLTAMVDFATIVSFLTAPVLGYLNLRVVTRPDFPAAARPGRALLVLSYVGLVLLGGTAVVYLVSIIAG